MTKEFFALASIPALNRKLLARWLGVAALGPNRIDLMSSCRPNRLLLMTIAVDVVALHGLYAYVCPETRPPSTPSALTEA
jgi:hypothetical protein